MDEALVEDAEDDVDDERGGENKEALPREAWQALNDQYLYVTSHHVEGVDRRSRTRFLDKVIAEAQRQREARRESGKKELVEEFRAKAEAMGLSLDELLRSPASAGRPAGKARSPRKGAPAASPAVKYRNPDTGDTWSGRGRMPKWLALAEQSGRSREEFLAKG